jgi:Zn finger protein HypA/HybF involved in hydrogenase expression
MMVTKTDLTDIGDSDYKIRRGELIHCQDCFNDFGGTRGDYWMMNKDKAFECPVCGSENLALVRYESRRVVLKD